jgi:hypothetical protein
MPLLMRDDQIGAISKKALITAVELQVPPRDSVASLLFPIHAFCGCRSLA